MHKFDIDLGGLHFEYKNNEKECERNFFKGYAGRGKIRQDYFDYYWRLSR